MNFDHEPFILLVGEFAWPSISRFIDEPGNTDVSGADNGIGTAFTDETREHQLDLIHVGRTLDYTLWDDGVFSLERRTEIVTEEIDEVFHLKNSVAKHRPKEEYTAIRSRIARTTERLEKTAWRLSQFRPEKASEYLRRWLASMVTVAEHALEGIEIHDTSNALIMLPENIYCLKNMYLHAAEPVERCLARRRCLAVD